MKTYIARRRIDHNNQVFEENEQIDLDDSAAKPLLAVGAVVEIEKPVEIPAPANPDGSGNENTGDASGGNSDADASEVNSGANANAEANTGSGDAGKTENAAAGKTSSKKTTKDNK